MANSTDSEFLQWIHDRLYYVHGENTNYDYMHRLRDMIVAAKKNEQLAIHLQGLPIYQSKMMPKGALYAHPETLNPPELDVKKIREVLGL